jgi:DMSO reductase family type II enzyme iron-sulfur subunit
MAEKKKTAEEIATEKRQKELAKELQATKERLRHCDRQIAMVMDLNKCIGCQTCSVACKTLWTDDEARDYMWWNTVNTQPGAGTPKDWEKMGGGYKVRFEGKVREPIKGKLPSREEFGEAWKFNYDEVYQGSSETTYLHPVGEEPEWGMNWDEDQGGGSFPNAFYFYLPRICNHCTYPTCLDACPRNAIYKREEDGIVVIDEERCKGYRFCIEACPYKKIYFNKVDLLGQKCIFCYPRIEKGVAPACARQCPARARWVGWLDDETGPIYQLVKKWKVALPLHPEYGTEPNVFYVPPLAPPRLDATGKIDETKPRIPLRYLEYLFGPEVGKALTTIKTEMEKRRNGQPSELMEILIAKDWKSMFKPFDKDPATLTWERKKKG